MSTPFQLDAFQFASYSNFLNETGTVFELDAFQIGNYVGDGPAIPVSALYDSGEWPVPKNRNRLIKIAALRERLMKDEAEIEFLITNGYI